MRNNIINNNNDKELKLKEELKTYIFKLHKEVMTYINSFENKEYNIRYNQYKICMIFGLNVNVDKLIDNFDDVINTLYDTFGIMSYFEMLHRYEVTYDNIYKKIMLV